MGSRATPMPSQPPLLDSDGEISEFQMNALCMRYGIAAAPVPSENALLAATTTVVRDNLKCYEPSKRVYKRDIERAKANVQNQYDGALRAIQERRNELAAAKILLKEHMPEN
ncbi:unnamed protein product [Nippostrongylus brasiliensis]|uniref:Uncharacterized protein n=1 Tax=Nippostrongylus brasiliensis TaxID=27835 RepID=A0A0N4Y2Q3_NIPBR|nr:unnamed protein product [Nippostrongylus brasiliensis]